NPAKKIRMEMATSRPIRASFENFMRLLFSFLTLLSFLPSVIPLKVRTNREIPDWFRTSFYIPCGIYPQEVSKQHRTHTRAIAHCQPAGPRHLQVKRHIGRLLV